MRILGLAALGAALAGCASTQLTYNALDLASTSSGLITSQVLENLSRFRAVPYATASQVSIPSGSATTTNSVTPTLGGPVGISSTTALANTAAAAVSNTTTRTLLRPNNTVGVSATDQYSQNYTITPLQDPGQLARLRALYRFGARQTGRPGLLCEYPLVQKEAGSGGSGSSVNVYIDGNQVNTENSKDEKQGARYTRGEACADNLGDLDTPDPAFLKPPGCVICDYHSSGNGGPAKSAKLRGSVNGNIITEFQNPDRVPLKQLLGATITGYCIPFGTTITSIDSESQIHISRSATCKGPLAFEGPPRPRQQQSHMLEVNRLLRNDWIVFGNPAAPLPGDLALEQTDWPLGHFGDYDVYVKDGRQKAYSDFVLFVLEATLQSTSSSGGSGKGTPQKGGTPAPLQLPAAATLLE